MLQCGCLRFQKQNSALFFLASGDYFAFLDRCFPQEQTQKRRAHSVRLSNMNARLRMRLAPTPIERVRLTFYNNQYLDQSPGTALLSHTFSFECPSPSPQKSLDHPPGIAIGIEGRRYKPQF